MSSSRPIVLAALASLAACKENLLDDLSDAAGIDAVETPIPPGDFSCVGTPYPTTSPDPLSVRGHVGNPGMGVGGAPVEVRSTVDDTLLFMDVTDTSLGDRAGKYSGSIATGGMAPQIYRKISGIGERLDTYNYDGIPVSSSYELYTALFPESFTASLYQSAGVQRDLTKGMLIIDVFDCSIPPAPNRKLAGLTVEVPPGASVLYADEDYVFDPTLTATTSTGSAMLLNVTPGFVDLDVYAGPITYRSWPVRVFANSYTVGPRHP